MARYKRPFGVVAGPFLVVVALLGYWGVQSGLDVKHQIQGWAYAFEHSDEPVVMDMPDIPMFPPLIVNGERVGRLERVTLLRQRAGTVDQLAVVASVGPEHLADLEGCALRLRVRSLDVDGYTRALRCTRNTRSLIPFGELRVEGSNLAVPIMVREGDLPCRSGHTGQHACSDVTIELSQELQALQRELARNVTRVEGHIQGQLDKLEAVDLEGKLADLEVAIRKGARETARERVRVTIR